MDTAKIAQIKERVGLSLMVIHESIKKGLASQDKAAPPKKTPIIPTIKAAKESPQVAVVQ